MVSASVLSSFVFIAGVGVGVVAAGLIMRGSFGAGMRFAPCSVRGKGPSMLFSQGLLRVYVWMLDGSHVQAGRALVLPSIWCSVLGSFRWFFYEKEGADCLSHACWGCCCPYTRLSARSTESANGRGTLPWKRLSWPCMSARFVRSSCFRNVYARKVEMVATCYGLHHH